MTTQSKMKAMTKGTCSFCNEEFDKAKMTQHLKYCKQRATAIAASGEDGTKQKQRMFHILAEGRYNPQYWMHLEVPAAEWLATVDSFFKAVWVECCGHLSAFEIDGTSYSDEPGDYSYIVNDTETQEEEEEEYEDLKPEELAAEIGKFLDEYVADEGSLISAELLAEIKIPRSRDDLVAFLKEQLKAQPKRSVRYAIEDRQEHLRLYWLDQLLNVLLEMVEDTSLSASLEKVLKVGQKFKYEYDFGSTTDLNLRVVTEREGVLSEGKKNNPITILARNVPPEILCQVCGKPATKVVSGYFNVEENAYCNKCAKRNGDAEMMLPVVNSPRVGVCGYTGR